MDAIDHERRINDQNRRIGELKSNLLKLESVHRGYKDTNNELVATLRTDVNDTRAKIPELRRDYRAPLPVSRRPSTRSRPLSMTYANSPRHRSTHHQWPYLLGAHRSILPLLPF